MTNFIKTSLISLTAIFVLEGAFSSIAYADPGNSSAQNAVDEAKAQAGKAAIKAGAKQGVKQAAKSLTGPTVGALLGKTAGKVIGAASITFGDGGLGDGTLEGDAARKESEAKMKEASKAFHAKQAELVENVMSPPHIQEAEEAKAKSTPKASPKVTPNVNDGHTGRGNDSGGMTRREATDVARGTPGCWGC